jgi:hypothetical protein
VASPAIDALIRETVARELPDFERAPDLEDSSRALCFEHPASRRLLRFDIGRPKQHAWMIAFSYRVRPELRTLLDRGLPNQDLESAEVGAFPTATARDRERLKRWIAHYAAHFALIDFKDPFLERFLDGFVPDAEDEALGLATIRGGLTDAVLRLRGDVAKSELALPFGTLFVEQEPGHVSSRGQVPAFARLALDQSRVGTPDGWFTVNSIAFAPGLYMSASARERLLSRFFDEARQELATTGAWALVPDTEVDGKKIELVQSAGRLSLRPSRAYVRHLNSGRSAFLRLMQDIVDDSWRGIYEHADVADDSEQALEAALSAAPDQFEPYKALADFHAARGNAARSNVLLALGYLRARKLPGIARSKLELARSADPACPGLAEALAELEARAK